MTIRAFFVLMSMMCVALAGSAQAQQDVKPGHLSDMRAAFALYQEGELGKSAKAYQQIEESKGVPQTIKQAALEGRTMVEITKLRAALAAGDSTFLVKNRVDKMLRLAEGSGSEPSFTLMYLKAVANEKGAITSASFADTPLQGDYKRLAQRLGLEPAEVKTAPKATEPPAKKKTVAARPQPVRHYRVMQAINVRAGPGTTFDKIAQLQAETVVRVVQVVQDERGREWLVLSNQGGYVFASLLRQVTPVSKAKTPVKSKAQTSTQSGTQARVTTQSKPATAPAGATTTRVSCGAGVIARYTILKPVRVFDKPSGSAAFVGTLRPGHVIGVTGRFGGFFSYRADGACRFVANIKGALQKK